MYHAVLCYAASDWESASEVAAYLEVNCPGIAFDLEEFAAPARLLDAAERALSADFPILLLSPAAVPQPWPRDAWEPILVHEALRFDRQIAYVLSRPCKFPEVFRRGVFFDLSQGDLHGRRALKRWLLQRSRFSDAALDLPELPASVLVDRQTVERLEDLLSDRPGMEANICREAALAFAHAVISDFEGVFWLNCAHRSRAGIAGDVAHVLGMRLRGPLHENIRALREICASRRILLAFEQTSPEQIEWAALGGKASLLFVATAVPPAPRPFEETAALFARWYCDPLLCHRSLGDAEYHLRRLPDYKGDQRRAALSLSSSVCAFLKQAGRLAEACELLDVAIDALHAQDDPLAAAKLAWERSWIWEEWDRPNSFIPRLDTISSAVQLSLFG